jgi:hypothetical protein
LGPAIIHRTAWDLVVILNHATSLQRDTQYRPVRTLLDDGVAFVTEVIDRVPGAKMGENRRIDRSVQNVSERVRLWVRFHDPPLAEKATLVQIRRKKQAGCW